MILHLGVIDLPYVEAPAPGQRSGKRRPGPHKRHARRYANKTTGDVAEILEGRYHVMEHFSELHSDEIVEAIEGSLQGAVESLLMGGPPQLDAFGAGTSKIEDAFKQMLSQRELDGLGYPGIPTAAAESGVSHRRKRAYVKRDSRPSFVDTSLYQSSFKAWID